MTIPLKRINPFISYSKEHHFGLLLVWKVRQGIEKEINAERIANYIIYFFETDLDQHFKDEEQLLFTLLAKDNVLRGRAEVEHNKIFNLVKSIKINKQDENLLIEFADVLEKHIRFEERVLFNELQVLISQNKLLKIENRKGKDAQPMDSLWEDLFWK
jgi:hypothetical protein